MDVVLGFVVQVVDVDFGLAVVIFRVEVTFGVVDEGFLEVQLEDLTDVMDVALLDVGFALVILAVSVELCFEVDKTVVDFGIVVIGLVLVVDELGLIDDDLVTGLIEEVRDIEGELIEETEDNFVVELGLPLVVSTPLPFSSVPSLDGSVEFISIEGGVITGSSESSSLSSSTGSSKRSMLCQVPL